MNMYNSDFELFARSEKNISSSTLSSYASYINPTIIEERRLNVASMDVFSRLMMDRIIFLGVPVNDTVANIIQAQLLYLDSVAPSEDISIYINTPGGEVSAGLGIYDTMQLIQPKVSTICTGLAASMGAVLLSAGTRGMRSSLPHSKILIHQPIGGVRGQTSDVIIAAKEMEKTRKELVSILSAHTGQAYEKVFADADRDFWMTSHEALEYGVIDKILTKKQ